MEINEIYDNLLAQIEEHISKGEISFLREILTEINVVDTAQIMEDLADKNRLTVFRVLSKSISAEVFSYLEPDTQADLVRMITDAELERLLDEMFLDDTVDFLEEVPANVVTRVLAHSDPETRKLINRFLKYPEDCAGSLMTIEMVHLRTSLTASQAIEKIRKTGIDKETVYTCYCIDSEPLRLPSHIRQGSHVSNSHRPFGFPRRSGRSAARRRLRPSTG